MSRNSSSVHTPPQYFGEKNLLNIRKKRLENNTAGPDVVPYQHDSTNHSSMQHGGDFTKIRNPKTGRVVSIYGKTGKKILNNYMQYLHISNGGNIRSYKFGENPDFSSPLGW